MTVSLEVRLVSGDLLATLNAEPSWTAADVKASLCHLKPNERVSNLVIISQEPEAEFPKVGAEVLICSCFKWLPGHIVEIDSDGRIDAEVDGKIEKSIGPTRFKQVEKDCNFAGKRTIEEAGLTGDQSFLQAVISPYAGIIGLGEFDSITISEDGTCIHKVFEFAGSSMCGGSEHCSRGTWELDKATGEIVTCSGMRLNPDRLR